MSRAPRRDLAVDAALAAAALAITLVTLAQDDGPLGAGGVALAIASTVPLLVWRRAPLAVFVVTAAASAGIDALGYDLGLGVGSTVMVFFLARTPPAERPALTGFAVVGLFVALVGADYADGTWARSRSRCSVGCSCGASASGFASAPSAKRRARRRPRGIATSRSRASERGSRATCTTPPATRST